MIDRGAPPPPRRSPVDTADIDRPRTPTEATVTVLLEELLGAREIGREANVFELGGNSLLTAQLATHVQERLGVGLSLLEIVEHPDVAQISALIDERRLAASRDVRPAEETSRCLVQIRRGSLPALFCLHPAGESFAAVRQFLPELDAERAVYGVWAPRPAGRYDPTSSVEDMVDHLLPELQRVQPDGPYLLSGYSLGGLLAYGLAGRLRDLGHEVRFLGIIDTPTPAEVLGEWTWRSRTRAVLRGGIGRAVSEAMPLVRGRVRERLSRRRSGRWGAGARPDIADSEVAALLGRRYRPVGHDARLVVFVARSRIRVAWPRALQQRGLDPVTGRWSGHPRTGPDGQRERSLGWSELHRGPVGVVVVPGDHGSVLIAPNVQVLARALAEAIRESEAAALAATRPA